LLKVLNAGIELGALCGTQIDQVLVADALGLCQLQRRCQALAHDELLSQGQFRALAEATAVTDQLLGTTDRDDVPTNFGLGFASGLTQIDPLSTIARLVPTVLSVASRSPAISTWLSELMPTRPPIRNSTAATVSLPVSMMSLV
jgi:hypothetical protein